MYAVVNSDNLIETVTDTVDVSSEVFAGHTLVECGAGTQADVGKLYGNGVYSKPTPFHRARSGVWVLDDHDATMLREHVFKMAQELIEQAAPADKIRIQRLAVLPNITKAFILISKMVTA